MVGEVHPEWSDADYFAHPGVNHSTLKWLVERTPAHYRYRIDNPEHDPTPDMEFGSAVHSLVLGGPPVVGVAADNWRTKAAQQEAKEARAAGGIPLLLKDFRRANACARAVKDHALAAKLLDTADHLEVGLVWDDDGVTCKAKVDGISKRIGWDLKTTYDASTEAFGRSTAKYGYHSEQAHYLAGIKACLGVDAKFLFLVVEKEPPHLVNVIQLEDYAVELGAKRNARALDLYRASMASGEWPGYGSGINEAQLPRWAEYQEEEAS